MKKTSLLLGAAALAFSASAQTAIKSDVFGQRFSARQVVEEQTTNPAQVKALRDAFKSSALNKNTGATERWYDFFGAVEFRESADFNANGNLLNMWGDSTVRQRYSTGLGTVNYSSVMTYIDPINPYGMFNDPNTYLGELKIDGTHTYKVDTLNIRGSYIANLNRPGGIVDTLIVTVAPASPGRYSIHRSQYNNAQYLPASADTFYTFTQYKVDSVNRTLWSDIGDPVANRYMIKVPLTVNDRDTIDANGSIAVKNFTTVIPGGFTLAAGRGFSVAYTFKSGDTWTANVDSLTSRHRWLAYCGEVTPSGAMPYYYYDYFPTYPLSARYGERSMSGLMFSTSPDRYLPSPLIESINTNDFRYEFASIAAHLKCDSCPVISGIKNVSNFANVASAYPNPATSEVNLSFTTKNASVVSAVVTNMTGQTVMAQEVGKFNANQNGKVTFNTSNLSNGMYFISVESQGQRVTRRFVVAH